MTPDELFPELADHWRSLGVRLLPPATEEEIVETIRALGGRPSADVLALYKATGGFVGGEMDGLWNLWSLEAMRRWKRWHRPPDIIFADYLISSHVYCLQYESADVSSVYIEDSGVHIPSLTEFFELYVTDPESVWAFQCG